MKTKVEQHCESHVHIGTEGGFVGWTRKGDPGWSEHDESDRVEFLPAQVHQSTLQQIKRLLAIDHHSPTGFFADSVA